MCVREFIGKKSGNEIFFCGKQFVGVFFSHPVYVLTFSLLLKNTYDLSKHLCIGMYAKSTLSVESLHKYLNVLIAW